MSLTDLTPGRYPGGVLVAAALESAGVSHTFGIPGTHNIELYDALASSTIQPVLVTDEQSAGFIADGMARSGGPISVANVVPGAGVTHLLSGVGEAMMDNVPMLVLTCGIRADTSHRYQLHDVDQLAILRPLCKAVYHIEAGAQIPRVIGEAIAVARAGCPGPVAVEVPANLYLTHHRVDAADLSMPSTQPAPCTPDPQAVALVRDVLANARRPLLHVGLGAAHAAPRLIQLAERIGAMVTTTISGKGVIPEDHPQWLWPGLGNITPPPLRRIAAQADAALIIGARMGEVSTGSYGLSLPRPAVHVDIDPDVIGANFPVDHGVVADAAAFVEALLDHLDGHPIAPREVAGLTRQIAQAHACVNRSLGRRGDPARVSPSALMTHLQSALGDTTRFSTDSGKGTFIAMEHLRLMGPRQMLSPVDFSCMGYAVPAAIGASLAHPGEPVVALAGDGALLMTGLELITARQLGLPIIVVVLNDGELGQISAFQRAITARPVCTTLPGYDLAAFAATVGVPYICAHTDDVLPDAIQHAVAATQNGPVLVDVAIDYSAKTFFAKGVVKTNFGRLPWVDRLRMVSRVVGRKVTA